MEDLETIREIAVKVVNGMPVKVGDVAEVQYGNEIRRGAVTRNGNQEVVSGLVLKLFGENTSEVIEHLYKKVEDVQTSLPEGVTLVPYYEQAELVEQATWTVKKALIEGAFLVEKHQSRHILDRINEVGQFDDKPGTGIAVQLDVEDAVGVAHQAAKITSEIEDLL